MNYTHWTKYDNGDYYFRKWLQNRYYGNYRDRHTRIYIIAYCFFHILWYNNLKWDFDFDKKWQWFSYTFGTTILFENVFKSLIMVWYIVDGNYSAELYNATAAIIMKSVERLTKNHHRALLKL